MLFQTYISLDNLPASSLDEWPPAVRCKVHVYL